MAKVAATPPVLSLSCLRNALAKVAHKWYQLGIQLDIDDGDLSIISPDTSRTSACLRQVIRYFIDNTDLSDEDRKKKLVKAMKSPSVGEIRRGSKLERELRPPLTMKKLTTALSDVTARWHSLGLQLDIPISKLNDFEAGYNRDVKRYFSDMLALWCKQGPTINALTEALRCDSVQERRLAQVLEEKYSGYTIQEDSEGSSDAGSGYD